MKIPKRIEDTIRKRVRGAIAWHEADRVLSKWLEDNGIEVDCEDYNGGVESLINPEDSAEHIRQAIVNYPSLKNLPIF